MSGDAAAGLVSALRPHQLIGLDASGHICSACGRVPDFPSHIVHLALSA